MRNNTNIIKSNLLDVYTCIMYITISRQKEILTRKVLRLKVITPHSIKNMNDISNLDIK